MQFGATNRISMGVRSALAMQSIVALAVICIGAPALAQSPSADTLAAASADENYARYQERRRAAIEALQAPIEGAVDVGASPVFQRGDIQLSGGLRRAHGERPFVLPEFHERADAAYRAPRNAAQQLSASSAVAPPVVVTTWGPGRINYRSVSEEGRSAGNPVPAPGRAPGSLAEAVDIPDSALREAIASGLDKESGETITEEDMATVRSIHAEYAGIADLTGLRYAINLMRLDLDGNEIGDVSELENLTSLRHLSLDGNGVTDLSPLANLTNLKALDLSHNGLDSIDALARLTNLAVLALGGNSALMDLRPLENLSALTRLYLYGNGIEELDALGELNQLQFLTLGGNRISDIDELESLSQLEELHLWGNAIEDTSPLSRLTRLKRLYLQRNSIAAPQLAGLTSLERLSLDENGITSLAGLSGLTALEWLSLRSNQIVDIEPLSGMTALEWLSLFSNQIVDIEPLAGMTALEWLSLGSNQIGDIEPLSGMTALEELWLFSNQIVDIEPLSGMTALELLTLSSNQIVNIEPLSGMTALNWLSLSFNQIVDTEPLSGITALKELWLLSNQIVDVAPLTGMTALELLTLDFNQIVDIEPLSSMTALKALTLSFNEIVDIEPLSGMTALEILLLPSNQIVDIEPLSGMTALKGLLLSSNQIVDIEPLTGKTALVLLTLDSNQIVDIEPLSGMTALEELDLSSNQIVDVEPLSGMTALEELDLSSNQIVDIEPLTGMTALEELGLYSNQIVDVEPLSGMTALELLSLSRNQIVDIAPLTGLMSLKELWLYSNPLDEQSINTHAPVLSGRGVVIWLGIPDLTAASPSVSSTEIDAGASFHLSVTVSNTGNRSASAVLHYYRSLNAILSTADMKVHMASSWLTPGQTIEQRIQLTAPPAAGTYYYGACADTADGETHTANNCSTGARLTVSNNESDKTYAVDDPLPGVPTSGAFDPAVTSNATVSTSGDTTTISLDDDGYIELDDGTRFTCNSSGGCEVIDGVVTKGSITGSSETTPSADDRPELVVEAPTVSDTNLDTGERFTLRATVRNLGGGRSASTTLRYYRSSDANISTGDTEMGTNHVSGLNAEWASSRSIYLTAPSEAGTYYYGACVDTVTREWDTANNCSTGVTVTVSGSDLVVDTPTVSDSAPEAGNYFTLRATVRNQGGGRAGYTTLRYYRSSDASISSNDTEIGRDFVSRLAGSGTSNQSIRPRAPSEAGTYYYGACVDTVAGETDTANNCSTGVPVTVSGSDLVVDTPTVSDSAPDAGERFTLRATVRNLGGSRSASTTLRYYRSSDATISIGDTEVGTDSVLALGTNRTSSESITLTAPSQAGTYYYGACVESVSSESNTANNCSTGVQVTVSGGGGGSQPDLMVDAPTVSDSAPDAGESFTLSTTVRNQGGDRAASTTLRYYRSSNATISTSDTEVGTDPVGALDAAGASSESITLTAPSQAGTYYYGACVDSVTDESDTANNCSTGMRVTISNDGTGGGSTDSYCRDGDRIDPGDRCDIYSTDQYFEVLSDGRVCQPGGGIVGCFSTRSRIRINTSITFHADPVGALSWTIVDVEPEPPE